jgi:hypothetical protein
MLPVTWREWVAREFEVQMTRTPVHQPSDAYAFNAAVLGELSEFQRMTAGRVAGADGLSWTGQPTGPKRVEFRVFMDAQKSAPPEVLSFEAEDASSVRITGSTVSTQISFGASGMRVAFDEAFDPVFCSFLADTYGRAWP